MQKIETKLEVICDCGCKRTTLVKIWASVTYIFRCWDCGKLIYVPIQKMETKLEVLCECGCSRTTLVEIEGPGVCYVFRCWDCGRDIFVEDPFNRAEEDLI